MCVTPLQQDGKTASDIANSKEIRKLLKNASEEYKEKTLKETESSVDVITEGDSEPVKQKEPAEKKSTLTSSVSARLSCYK